MRTLRVAGTSSRVSGPTLMSARDVIRARVPTCIYGLIDARKKLGFSWFEGGSYSPRTVILGAHRDFWKIGVKVSPSISE